MLQIQRSQPLQRLSCRHISSFCLFSVTLSAQVLLCYQPFLPILPVCSLPDQLLINPWNYICSHVTSHINSLLPHSDVSSNSVSFLSRFHSASVTLTAKLIRGLAFFISWQEVNPRIQAPAYPSSSKQWTCRVYQVPMPESIFQCTVDVGATFAVLDTNFTLSKVNSSSWAEESIPGCVQQHRPARSSFFFPNKNGFLSRRNITLIFWHYKNIITVSDKLSLAFRVINIPVLKSKCNKSSQKYF